MAKKSIKKKKETELQRAFKWVNSLSGEKAGFIKEFANWQSRKDVDKAVSAIDRCTSAAIVNVLDVDWKVIEEIQDNLTHYLAEDIEKMNENRIRYGGLDMASKKINEQEKIVKERVNELIDQGVKQKEMVKTLSLEFPMLSKAMVTNAIKRIKTERLKDTEEAAKYILEENKQLKDKMKEEAKEIAKSFADNLEKELEKEDHIAEVGQMVKEEIKEEVKEEKEMVKGLEILEEVVVKTVKAKGNNGVYEAKTGVGVALENEGYKLAFKNVDELNEFYNEFKKMFEVI